MHTRDDAQGTLSALNAVFQAANGKWLKYYHMQLGRVDPGASESYQHYTDYLFELQSAVENIFSCYSRLLRSKKSLMQTHRDKQPQHEREVENQSAALNEGINDAIHRLKAKWNQVPPILRQSHSLLKMFQEHPFSRVDFEIIRNLLIRVQNNATAPSSTSQFSISNN